MTYPVHGRIKARGPKDSAGKQLIYPHLCEVRQAAGNSRATPQAPSQEMFLADRDTAAAERLLRSGCNRVRLMAERQWGFPATFGKKRRPCCCEQGWILSCLVPGTSACRERDTISRASSWPRLYEVAFDCGCFSSLTSVGAPPCKKMAYRMSAIRLPKPDPHVAIPTTFHARGDPVVGRFPR